MAKLNQRSSVTNEGRKLVEKQSKELEGEPQPQQLMSQPQTLSLRTSTLNLLLLATTVLTTQQTLQESTPNTPLRLLLQTTSPHQLTSISPHVYCRLVPELGGEGTTKPTKHDKTYQFCKTVNRTCCSISDFTKVEAWWEGSNTTMSQIERKAIEMTTLIGKFLKMQNYTAPVKLRINRTMTHFNSTSHGSPVCLTAAKNLVLVYQLGLINNALTHFEESSLKCWNYTKDLMNGMMCAACDADAQGFIDVPNSVVTISTAECRLFTSHCIDHIKSLWALTFYLDQMYTMAHCDGKGGYNGTRNSIGVDQKLIDAMNSCLQDKNKDDCSEVCRDEFSFSSLVRFEDQNLNNVIEYLRVVNSEFGELAWAERQEYEKTHPFNDSDVKKKVKNVTKPKMPNTRPKHSSSSSSNSSSVPGSNKPHTSAKGKPSAGKPSSAGSKAEKTKRMRTIRRRALEGVYDQAIQDLRDAVSKNAKNVTPIMQRLKVVIKDTGLNITNYTLGDSDGFETLNISLILGGGLLRAVCGVFVLALGAIGLVWE